VIHFLKRKTFTYWLVSATDVFINLQTF